MNTLFSGFAAQRCRGMQRGMTLVELMVGMVLGLVVAMLAAAVLATSTQGSVQVDVAAQLRENARFAQEVMTRTLLQAGYKNAASAAAGAVSGHLRDETLFLSIIPPVGITGRIALPGQPWSPPQTDTLNVGFQTGSDDEAAAQSDGGSVTCLGTAPDAVAAGRSANVLNAFFVHTAADGEPYLACSVQMVGSTGGRNAGSQTLVRGVENLQVLFGVDGVRPHAPCDLDAADSVPERYLHAEQFNLAPGRAGLDGAETPAWSRVRSVRVGMVLRGPPGSALERKEQTLYPLGEAFASAQDAGSTFRAPADGRLRQVLTFTVHLRNATAQGEQTDIACRGGQP